jgi:hypothetical protein
VQVRYSEGVALHTDPESCVGCREVASEALTGARIGGVLSGESNVVRGADAVVASRRQQVQVRYCEDTGHPASSLDPQHVRTRPAREPGYLCHRPGSRSRGRIGKAGGRSR